MAELSAMTLMTWGMFVFGMDTLAYDQLQRRIGWRHEGNARFGARDAIQYVGPGADDVNISGECIPEVAGTYSALTTLIEMADTGDAYALVDGGGTVWGNFYATQIDQTHRVIMAGGIPRSIDFTIDLKRKG